MNRMGKWGPSEQAHLRCDHRSGVAAKKILRVVRPVYSHRNAALPRITVFSDSAVFVMVNDPLWTTLQASGKAAVVQLHISSR
jgi:hypothetical protein